MVTLKYLSNTRVKKCAQYKEEEGWRERGAGGGRDAGGLGYAVERPFHSYMHYIKGQFERLFD